MHRQVHPTTYSYPHETEYVLKPVPFKHESPHKDAYLQPETTYAVLHQSEPLYHTHHTPTHKEAYKY